MRPIDGGISEVGTLAELTLPNNPDGHLVEHRIHRADSAGTPALRRCVAFGRDDFAERYWGRAPLLTRAAEFPETDKGFEDLLSFDAVDELLSRRGLRTPFLRVAKDGELVPPDRFTGGGGAGAEISDQVLDERVLALFASGATLVLQGLQRIWPPLVGFAARLAPELGCPVQVNAYLTPPGNRGFATHYDTHDVFVLQVAGRKHWRIHRPVLPDPLERQPWGGRAEEVASTAEGPPVLDVTLEPGDALYLPRGWLHAADALGERCLHLTVGLHRPNRYTLVEALLGLAAEEAALRAGLPLGLDLTDAGQLRPQLAVTIEVLRDWLFRVDTEALAERLRPRQWAARRPAPIRPVAQAEAIATTDHKTRITVRPGLAWRLTPADGPDRIELAVFDRTIQMPAGCEAAVRAALAGRPIRVGDLPGLDDPEDAIVLARRLLREAIVVPTED